MNCQMPRYILLLLSMAGCINHACSFAQGSHSLRALQQTVINVDSIPRLFSSPSQRAKLDRLRQQRQKPTRTKTTVTRKVDNHADISVTGYIKRSNGSTEIWIKQGNDSRTTRSHKSTQDTEPDSPVVSLPIPGNKHPVKIKPGQTWVRRNNQVLENWQISQPSNPNKNSNKASKPVTSRKPASKQ